MPRGTLRRSVTSSLLALLMISAACGAAPGYEPTSAHDATSSPTSATSTSAAATTSTTTTPTTAAGSTPTTTTPAATAVEVSATSEETGGQLTLSATEIGSVDGDAPDPALVQDGSVYLMYTTNASEESSDELLNVPVRASFDLSTWSDAVDALPTLPAWADEGHTWAPTVRLVNGVWVMYFAARERASGRQCIGIATSSVPQGPYVSTTAEPVICQTSLGGSIDPEIFTTASGETWLLWKSDGNCCRLTTSIWAARLGAYGLLAEVPIELLSANSSWQHGVIENPTVIETNGGFVLLYSGGRWNDRSYGTGVALCSSLASSCTNLSSEPEFDDLPGTYGSGGTSVTTLDDGRIVAIWHAWDRDHHRSTHLAEIDFT